MRNIWLVIKHDVKTTLRQRSYWVMALLMPVLLIGFNAYVILQESGTSGAGNEQQAEADSPSGLAAIGLVDPSGLIAKMPPGFPPTLFTRFEDEATARAALETDEIEQFVTIPADFVTSGEVTVYDKDFQLMSSGENMGLAFHSTNEWVLAYILNYSLTGDEQLVSALRNPVPGSQAEWHALSPPREANGNDEAQARLVSQILPLVYYFLLLMGSNYLLRSVVTEKENRTAEVLLLSIDPRQMMVGKILASSAVLFIQIAIWLGGGWFALQRGAQMLNVPAFTFAPGFLVWAIIFLVLGFLLFAAIMAAGGALAQNVREGAPMTWMLVIPLMPTLMFGDLFVREPNHPLTLFLSLFPFSAPSAMVTRLAVGNAPLWQVLVSLGLLAVTAYVFVVLAARFFRAGNLLSEASFELRQLATGWRR
jgi:ABC-2 type transport system permease protein